MLRGYHVYQDIWNATIRDELYCQGGIFFAEHNFRGQSPIRENRENYAPRKFGVIRYLLYFGDIPNLVSCAFSTIPIFLSFNSQNLYVACLMFYTLLTQP